MGKLSNAILTAFSLILIITSCKESSIFTACVKTIDSPNVIDLQVENIKTDYIYSQYFAVYDTLLITTLPNTTEYNFYIADLKNNKFLGAFMRRGQGPNEYLGLSPLKRFESKEDNLVALTFEPHHRELLEWNISKSLECGKDSVLHYGTYENANNNGLTYTGIYHIGNGKYLGQTSGYLLENEKLLPTYWIMDGKNIAPNQGLSIVKDMISNESSVIPDNVFFSSVWSLSPDNTKIVDAMQWLNQINVLNITNGSIHSYRVKGSPNESIFKTNMKGAIYQYHDVVCNDNSIFALYYGEPFTASKHCEGCYWIHEFDWEGNFVNRYRLPIPLYRLWMDTPSKNLYGYCESTEEIYKLKVNL